MLFIDHSSAFNTIVPSKLIIKLRALGLNQALCDWVLEFLTGHPQVVKVGNNTSTMLILITGTLHGCVLSPILYSLSTHDCVATHVSNSIIKFADETTVVGLIINNDKKEYRDEVRALAEWCQENSLSLNVNKTKELIVDFRRQQRELSKSTELQWTRCKTYKSLTIFNVHPPQCGEEGTTAPLQLQEAEEICLGP